MKNSRVPQHKRSRVERTVNRQLRWVLCLLLGLCLFCAILLGTWQDRNESAWYVSRGLGSPGVSGVVGFFTFLILFNNLIPISLYVSMELVKFFQGILLELDLKMYDAVREIPAVARTTSLNEELGQIDIVFSDKTGTLTCNQMQFVMFSAGGIKYGDSPSDSPIFGLHPKVISSRGYSIVGIESRFSDRRINDAAWQTEPSHREIEDLFLAMVLCNAVIPEHDESSVSYSSESPDEEALVIGAGSLDFVMKERTSDSITIEVAGKEDVWQLLNVLPFDSQRKRMSVVCRSSAGRLVLFTKGADSVIIPRLRPGQQHTTQTIAHLTEFGEDGLRTLLFGKLELDRDTYSAWDERYRRALRSVGDRAEQIAALAEDIERGLDLVGATAIEDRLQEDVPKTITALRAAGIKIWVLTGDKQETAMNIGYASSILDHGMTVMTLDAPDRTTIEANLAEFEKTIARQKDALEHALIVDGGSLGVVLAHQSVSAKFSAVSSECKTVICCRVTPLQKADVVNLERKRDPRAITLAIGDGANDVSMLNAAHVGIGISGMEGQQAANSADYSIAKFSFLLRLMLLHGHWNYVRLTKLVLYSFYKNALLQFTQFWFCLVNGFTGQSLYDQWALALFNVLFTALPIIIYSVLDRDILQDKHVLQFPTLYLQGRNNLSFNSKVFLRWYIDAIFHSVICFCSVVLLIQMDILPSGSSNGLAGIGLTLYSSVILVANMRLALEVNSWTIFHAMSVGGSIIIWFVFNFAFGEIQIVAKESFGVMREVAGISFFWLSQIIATAIALAPDYLWKYFLYNLTNSVRHDIEVQLLAAKDEIKEAPLSLADVSPEPPAIGLLTQPNNALQVVFRPRSVVRFNFTKNPLTLRFNENSLEREFVIQYIDKLVRYRKALAIGFVAALVIVMQSLTVRDCALVLTMWLLFCATCLGTFLALMFSRRAKRYAHRFLLGVMLVLCSFLTIAHLRPARATTHPVTLGVVFLGLLFTLRPPLYAAVQYLILGTISYVSLYRAFPVKPWFGAELGARTLEIVLIAVVGLLTMYDSERFLRNLFALRRLFETKKSQMGLEGARQLALLRNLLPEPVVQLVWKKGVPLTAFSLQYDASVLVCDIVHFTEYCSHTEAERVVRLLNNLFTKFDKACTQLRIEKVKTIGDAYVCAAGLPLADKNHALKIAEMGLAVVRSVQQAATEEATEVKMRVGIACGSVTAGIVGKTKMCYDVFGPAVAKAFRMEATGTPGKVQASVELYHTLVDHFTFENDAGRYFVTGKVVGAWGREYSVAERTETIEIGDTSDVASDEIFEHESDTILAKKSKWLEAEHPISAITLKFLDQEIEQEYLTYRDVVAKHQRVVVSILGVVVFAVLLPLYVLLFGNCDSLWGCYQVESGSGCPSNDEKMVMTLPSSGVVLPCCLPLHGPLFISIVVLSAIHLLVLAIVVYPSLRPASHRRDVSMNDAASVESENIYDEEIGIQGALLSAETEITDSVWRDWHFLFSVFSICAVVVVTLASLIAIKNKQIGIVLCFIVAANLVYIFSFYYFLFVHKVLFALFYFIAILICYFISTGRSWRAADIFAVVIVFILAILSTFTLEKSFRSTFATAKKVITKKLEVQRTIETNERILNQMLPKSVLVRLRTNPMKPIIDRISKGSVIFVLFEGLDDFIQSNPPKMGLLKLNSFLAPLDHLTRASGTEKIKTHPYLVVAGCPEECEDHAERAVGLARQILIAVQEFNESSDAPRVKVRVGIHSGSFFAGVLGTQRFVYDVFGDAINMSYRLAETAPWGRAQVSNETRDLCRRRRFADFQLVTERQQPLKGYQDQDIRSFLLCTTVPKQSFDDMAR
eukprot:TRINITY_DN1291_c0_g1_i1.p1 TRINITY_DN1291_c0_g1~~TRINITY_DN1291_c0_g1_i1.p1  ORF type:complete len:1838 (+),score=333.22 TRINITY_DN1291_c0_g1_i1:867-6380(+)